MDNNRAAWLTAAKATPLVVGPGPKPAPLADEVVIRVGYVAINPVDWKVQTYGVIINTFPNVLGTDVAGVIVQVGSGVTRLKVGQRVIGHCSNLYTQKPTDAAFQNFATVKDTLTAPIPDELPFANAAVLPLGFSTAASGLCVKSAMTLPFPSLTPTETGKTVLIWGGSSSVGANAVQLAKSAGMTVITTASPKNHDFVEALGADKVIDHANTAVVDDIVKSLHNARFAGAFDAIGVESSCRACAEVVSQLGGGVLTTVLFPVPEGLPENVKASFVSGLYPAFEEPYIGEEVWKKYLPAALAQGKFQVKPDPYIIKGGLEKVQDGIDKLRGGVSASKVVVEIDAEV